MRTSRDQAVAQQRQVDALRRAFDLANRRYQNGVSSYLEVLDAERNLFASELALTQAQRQELVAGVQLYKALGGAWTETPGSQVTAREHSVRLLAARQFTPDSFSGDAGS